jgi:glutamate 5-kinase
LRVNEVVDNQTPLDWSQIKTVVVKLGTQLLSDQKGKLDPIFMGKIAKQVAGLRQRGVMTTIVSSGAVGAGVAEMGLPKRPTDLARLQAVAAVGQRCLMDAWNDAFEPSGLKVAQLLLTREDIDDRSRFLNVRNTIHAAQELGVVPIINENDTISTDELVKITFGDNDYLAAVIASALRADLLVLLTVVDGLLDSEGKSVRVVQNASEARELVRAEKSGLGKGGMESKLQAAKLVTESGEAMVIANGRDEDVLIKILNGERVGTTFVPANRRRNSRSRWIGAARPAGSIVVDGGAVKALVEQKKSLLPAGIVKVEGHFVRGDVVEIVGPDGKAIAQGLCNYGTVDLERIRGKKTSAVRELLGDGAYDEVVHRDNLVIFQGIQKGK